VPERSQPDKNHWFLRLHVRIANEAREPAQLVSPPLDHHRRQRATCRKVRGPGVVGEQPLLAPGEAFEYNLRLPTSRLLFGTMHGTFTQMVTRSGEKFDAQIAAFTLSEPTAIN